jgi:hypothetical protein
MSDGHMTPEEVERHLESRQTYLELVPEKAPPTVPTEMFSNDPSLDRYVLLDMRYIRGQQQHVILRLLYLQEDWILQLLA